MQVSDLPESTLHSGVFLYCHECDSCWSATRGDYFWMAGDEQMTCANDGAELVLASAQTQIIEVAR